MIYYLVQGDTGTQIKVTLAREGSSEEVDLTNATVLLKVRREKQPTLAFTVTGLKTTNVNNEVVFKLGNNMINIDPGRYEGEVQVTFSDSGTQVEETVYETVNLFIREEF